MGNVVEAKRHSTGIDSYADSVDYSVASKLHLVYRHDDIPPLQQTQAS